MCSRPVGGSINGYPRRFSNNTASLAWNLIFVTSVSKSYHYISASPGSCLVFGLCAEVLRLRFAQVPRGDP